MMRFTARFRVPSCLPTATSSRSTPATRSTGSPTSSSSAAASPGCGPRSKCPPTSTVLVVTKDRVSESNSTYAQGGIAGVLSPEDRFENHIEDTLAAGGGLCDRDSRRAGRPRSAGRRSTTSIRWGTQFDEEDGQLALTREGGHSHRRIVHALGDATGFEVMRADHRHGPHARRTSRSGTTPSPSTC